MSKKMDSKKKFDKNKSAAKKKNSQGGFQTMGLSWQVLKGVLNNGYKIPTPIQRKTIPLILVGKDVVAMARTGSGKTAAFLIPMFQRLVANKPSNAGSSAGPRALIMSPTRELALQTFRFTKLLGKSTNLRAAVILGGDKIENQFEVMHENPDIIIATPGRFLHITIEMSLKLNTIEYVVFDEADRLFEMGFKEQLNEILHKLPSENRQTLLFSATLPESLVEFAKAGLQQPLLIRLDTEAKLSENLKTAFIECRFEDKLTVLIYLLNNVIKAVKTPDENEENKMLKQTVIFVATKHHVEFLKELLEHLGYAVSYAYSSLDQAARKINIAKFHNKKTSILIVTDVAARGIDIPLLDNCINFNFPAKAKLFVHRVGRVARAGQTGNAYSIVSSDEVPYVYDLHEFLGKTIKFAKEKQSPEDWNEVYGSVPQNLIDIERENLENIINTKIELSSALYVQNNAYKQYLKSRTLPGSNSIKLAKKQKHMHECLPIHPLLKLNNDEISTDFETQVNLLNKLKNYKTKATIFEINKTPQSQQSSLIMRNKRAKHDVIVEREKTKLDNHFGEKLSLFEQTMGKVSVQMLDDGDSKTNKDKNERGGNGDNEPAEDVEYKTFENEGLDIKITNANDESGVNDDGRARKKRKLREIIDKEHFIPYKPKNYETEKALGINTSFQKEASRATLDLTADDADELRKTLQKTKWDRKKKKFVSASDDNSKTKKVKTESGRYINASYSSNLYTKWLKKSKSAEGNNENNDDEDGKPPAKKQKHFGSNLQEKVFFGSHKYKSVGKPGVKRFSGDNSKSRRTKSNENNNYNNNKKSNGFKSNGFKPNGFKSNNNRKLGLKNKDQIIKERNRKAKIQSFQKKRQQTKSSKKRK